MPDDEFQTDITAQLCDALRASEPPDMIIERLVRFDPDQFDFLLHTEDPMAELVRLLRDFSPQIPDAVLEDFSDLTTGQEPSPVARHVVVHSIEPSNQDPHNITRFLADGGVGRVWIADDKHLGREVVLKQLLPTTSDNNASRTRFVNEARITGQLQHPNIVPVYSMDHDLDDLPYYTMRYIRGETYSDHIRKLHQNSPLNFRSPEFLQALEIFISICNAVAYAHSRHIVHCDLKPENVGIGQFGEVTVLDWGLASEFNSTESSDCSNGDIISGTPNYLSPEQAAGQSHCLRPPSDIYSLGAILFEVLFNRPPRHVTTPSPTLQQLLNSVVTGDIPNAVQLAPRAAGSLPFIVNKCLATNPLDRYQSVDDIITDLHHWRDDHPVTVAPNPVTSRISRFLRRNQRVVATAISFLLVALTVSMGFYIAVTNSRKFLASARKKEYRQQTTISQQQTELVSATAAAVDARNAAEHGRLRALKEYELSLDAKRDHERQRATLDKATREADDQSQLAHEAQFEAEQQTRRAVDNRKRLEQIRERTVALSAQRQRATENGYVRSSLTLAANGEFQRSLVWAARARNQAISNNRDESVVLEHELRLLSIFNHLPVLEAFRYFNQPGMRTVLSHSSKLLIAYTTNPTDQMSTIHYLDPISFKELRKSLRIPLIDLHLRFTPNDEYLCIAGTQPDHSGSNLIVVVNIKSGVQSKIPTSNSLSFSAMSTTDQLVVAATELGHLATYSIADGILINSIQAHRSRITDIDVSENGSMIATASSDNTARIWETQTLAPLTTVLEHKRPVVDVHFSTQRNDLRTTTANGFSLNWNSAAFLTRPSLTAGPRPDYSASITSISLHPHGLLTAMGTSTGKVHIFNAPGSEFIAPFHFQSGISNLQFSRDGRLLAIGTENGNLSIYDFTHRRSLYRAIQHGTTISDIRFSPDSQYISTTNINGELRSWNIANRHLAPHKIRFGIEPSLTRITSSGTGVLTVFDKTELHRLNFDANTLIPHATRTFAQPITGIYLSPHTKHAAIVMGTNAQIVDTVHLSPVGSPIEHAGPIHHVTFDRKGTYAVSSADRTISMGNVHRPPTRVRLTSMKRAATKLFFSDQPDSLIAICDSTATHPTAEILLLSYTDDQVLKSTPIGPAIQSTGRARANLSAPIFALTTTGTIHAFHPTTIEHQTMDLPRVTPRLIQSAEHSTLILFKDDTMGVIGSDGGAALLSSDSHTKMMAHEAERGWVAKATADRFTVQSVATGQVLIPPIMVPHAIQSIHFASDSRQSHIVVTTLKELFHFPISLNSDEAGRIVTDDQIHLVAAVELDEVGHETRLSGHALTQLSSRDSSSRYDQQQRNDWLLEYSTKLTPETWNARLQLLRRQYASLMIDSPRAYQQQITDELSYALLASQRFVAAYDLLLSDDVVKPTPKMIYQATVLAAWLQDPPRYQRGLALLIQTADPRIPQNFVYLVTALSLMDHSQDTSSIEKAIDRLPDRLKSNPLVQRAQVGFAISQADPLRVRTLLQQVPPKGVPFPVRIYYRIANEWITPIEARPSRFSYDQILSQIQVLPALTDGNPGSQWSERCLLDLILRSISPQGDTHLQ